LLHSSDKARKIPIQFIRLNNGKRAGCKPFDDPVAAFIILLNLQKSIAERAFTVALDSCAVSSKRRKWETVGRVEILADSRRIVLILTANGDCCVRLGNANRHKEISLTRRMEAISESFHSFVTH